MHVHGRYHRRHGRFRGHRGGQCILAVSAGYHSGKWISLALAVLTLLDIVAGPYFRYYRYRYSINDECIDIIEGYLFVKRSIVPIERIHKLQTAKGPFDQIFKVAKVIVTTGGGDVTLSFVEEEKAEQIAESLRRRINEIVKEQRSEDGRK